MGICHKWGPIFHIHLESTILVMDLYDSYLFFICNIHRLLTLTPWFNKYILSTPNDKITVVSNIYCTTYKTDLKCHSAVRVLIVV